MNNGQRTVASLLAVKNMVEALKSELPEQE